MAKKKPDTIIISDIMNSLSPISSLLTPEQIEDL